MSSATRWQGLLVQIMAIYSNENLSNGTQNWPKEGSKFRQSLIKPQKLPKTFEILPKRQIFAKSDQIA